MSGHSKWANIKNRKGAQDKKRSEAFTRLAKDILTAIRTNGGNSNPDSNLNLKIAIDKAKVANMPKDNIERLLTRFEERKMSLVSILLEGYGPFGVPLIIDAETDNKNRILGEIKLIFRNYGGTLGESNSVMYQFQKIGEVEIENIDEDKQLELIDIGALDFDGNLVLVKSEDMAEFVKRAGDRGFSINRSEVVYRAINPTKLGSEEELEKIMDFIGELEDNDDVIGVYAGFDYN